LFTASSYHLRLLSKAISFQFLIKAPRCFNMGEKPLYQRQLLLVFPQVCLGNSPPAHLLLSPVCPEKITGHICKLLLLLNMPAVAEDGDNAYGELLVGELVICLLGG